MNINEHLLVCLAEECAEVQHAIGKALRFGLTDHWDEKNITNGEAISLEIIDVLAVVGLLQEFGVITDVFDETQFERKQEKVRRFMAYAKSKGTITTDGEGK